jgi:FkbM family methyltransferase
MKNRISVHEVALSNCDGTSFFYPLDKTKTNSSNEGIASLSKLKNYMNGSLLNDKWVQKQITVSTSTMDTWCLKNNIQDIDLLWMDVQGAELKVLEGAKSILPKIKIICTEVGLVPYYEDHATKDQIDKIMFENNFIELKSAFCKTSWSNDLAAEADVIYLNKNFINLS